MLLIGSGQLHAGAHHKPVPRFPVVSAGYNRQTGFNEVSQGIIISKTSSLTKDNAYLVNVEEEEEELLLGRKYVLLAKYLFTLSYLFILSYFFSYFKNRLPSCWLLSGTPAGKYILQRVLRI
ncbi:hypothetical protein [Hufsiella ginkgonis]|uniref:Uncharacterized protein n=1 Tax=Hufsiella ginkgonis TaxID=2695274 RepID=A0A7K1Y2F0_9SPHI|nr:hypothetical protein [Hufsiella ginkgonis]MXV17248.1 hypothetical protein [Hufsiella ginkgonis]